MRRTAILILTLALGRTVSAKPCGQLLGAFEPGVLVFSETRRGEIFRFTLVDRARPRYRAVAGVEAGRLYLKFNLRDEQGRSNLIFGRDVVRVALATFGSRVSSVLTAWVDGDNLAAYNAAVLSGVATGEAARGTWTGRAVGEHGFATAVPLAIEGPRGEHSYVSYEFSRANTLAGVVVHERVAGSKRRE